MSPCKSVDVSLDILFTIIEEIGMQHTPDFDLLWAFCSTCRTLRPHAQKFLFHSISLELNTWAPCAPGFSIGIFWEHMQFIVKGNPHVAAHVKNLQFRTGLTANIPPKVIDLLSQFTNLSTLRCGYEERYAGWDILQESHKQWWESVVRLPSLTSLQIVNFWGMPISVIFPCMNLNALCIDECSTFSEPQSGGSLETISHLPLTNIVSVQTARDFSSLDPLFTVYPSIGVPLMDKNNVKSLFLPRIWDNECAKLKDFPSLRSFDVDISLLKHANSLFGNFHLSSLRSLDSLGMEFNFDLGLRTVYPSMALAAALTIPPGFPALSRVTITMSLDSRGYPAIKDSVNEELAKLDQLFYKADG
ncbi:hypothetical protein D9619_008490 [Psilocybe cf. subviscida]|uniref:Uncharacterized protein n=1 Tax=Psilocybe cf. subviscida TaxID=2480587 RepID=A0A8H5BA55_9AGAR|nr:hypothetical protein D9619_008490 [Psilocybe cf. subviscida]